MSVLFDVLGMYGERQAAKAKAKKQQSILDGLLGTQRSEFDTRTGITRQADAKSIENADAGYADSSGLEDRSFSDLLGLDAQGFDQQQTIASRAFNEQMDALNGLMTAQRSARLEMQSASEEERQRQAGFQASADSLAAALPSKLGSAAHSTRLADSWAQRNAATEAAASAAQVMAPLGNGSDELKGLFASEANRGRSQAVDQAKLGNKLSAQADAFAGGERELGSFADNILGLTRKAEMSRSVLPDELAVGGLKAKQAGERADFATGLADWRADGQSTAQRGLTSGLSGAAKTYADRSGASRDDYWTKKSSADVNWAQRLIDQSQGYESKLTNLANYRMGNTTGSSPWSTIAKVGKSFEDNFAKAKAGGG